MLLPSSLDCTPRKHPRTASYIPATAMLSPPSSTCQSPSSNMYSTCRALQSLLASNLPALSPSPKIIRAPPHLGSPIVLTSAAPRAQPKKPKSHPVQNAEISKPQPRSNLKRRRSFSIADDGRDEHTTAPSQPSTPKRQRTCPPSLPLGLSPQDFDALNHLDHHDTTPTNNKRNDVSASDTNTSPKTPTETNEPEWSTPDDSALVSLILNKLRLRQTDWDDCARRLGKEKDSIGRRWQHLLGDGEVGLRRGGCGGLRRGCGELKRGGIQRLEFGAFLPGVEEVLPGVKGGRE